ncbi:hypothetical protein BRD56_01480 [Thermoplasmatales archaeon SW_10_69_26]|nr:MAG: hypothetical protein BRD56_01480 [Thermoplasmatales archaeon SW_10_69_26]
MPDVRFLFAASLASPDPGLEDLDDQMPRGAAEGEIPALDDPEFGEGRWLRSEDPVIVVEVDDQARCYPLRVLDYHEIVDDEIAGHPVAVTFCPLSGAGIAWDRRVGDRELSFLVSGRLYRNDLVMKDRETGSLWPQILGRALHGELQCTQLAYVPTWRTTYGWFRQRYPDGLVLSRPGRHRAIQYESRANPGYPDSDQTLFEPEHEDERIPRKRRVVGLAHGDDALAIRRWDLEEVGLTIETVGGEDVILGVVRGRTVAWWTGDRTFTVDEDGYLVGPRGERWDSYHGREGNRHLEPAPVVDCFWFAWADIHPDTRLWHET